MAKAKLLMRMAPCLRNLRRVKSRMRWHMALETRKSKAEGWIKGRNINDEMPNVDGGPPPPLDSELHFLLSIYTVLHRSYYSDHAAASYPVSSCASIP
jgi:hypothetical protein